MLCKDYDHFGWSCVRADAPVPSPAQLLLALRGLCSTSSYNEDSHQLAEQLAQRFRPRPHLYCDIPPDPNSLKGIVSGVRNPILFVLEATARYDVTYPVDLHIRRYIRNLQDTTKALLYPIVLIDQDHAHAYVGGYSEKRNPAGPVYLNHQLSPLVPTIFASSDAMSQRLFSFLDSLGI